MSRGWTIFAVVFTAALLSGAGTAFAAAPPGATTLGAVPTYSHAGLTGQVETNDVQAVVGFEYGLTTEYGSESSAATVTGNRTAQETITIGGLAPGTTYHYRFGAINQFGITYGADHTFTTKTAPPVFLTTSSPAAISAGQLPEGQLTFHLEGMRSYCNTAAFGSGGTLLAFPAQSLALRAEGDEGCTAFGIAGATIDYNDCAFTVGAPQDLGEWSSLHLACAGGQEIEIHAAACTVYVPPQTLTSSTVIRNAEGSLEVELRADGFHYEKVRDGFLCALNGLGEGSDGTLTGALRIAATAKSGAATDLYLGFQ